MKKLDHGDNFLFLLLALLTLLFCIALFEQLFESGQALVLSALIFCLAFSILGVQREAGYTKSWLGLLLAMVATSYIVSVLTSSNLSLISLGLVILFLVRHLIAALRQVMFASTIGSNQIIGSICVYLMIGVIWAFVYLFLLECFGGGFSGITQRHWIDNLSVTIYYSFVTLTTLGYGEITPTLPVTRFFAYMESMTGSFYLAILVASLVSTSLDQRRQG